MQNHSCALLDDGTLRCWGVSQAGKLGYGNEDTIGDDELPASAGAVPVGGSVVELSLGAHHSCARLEGASIRCWGNNNVGQLGYGVSELIGDDETPASAGDVPYL